MGKSKPPKVHRYSMHFKATAVRLSDLPDVLIQDVADALDIHPFVLSRWRKQARKGGIVVKGVKLDDETVAELKRLRDQSKGPVKGGKRSQHHINFSLSRSDGAPLRYEFSVCYSA